ncbi:Coenzyme F420-reducing hydrogenase, beta subunit [Desulfonatronum zhilinae]|nr:Coenzyme F420-reducing hydrogenase, beta subunit [Desulfonatronum zhilinae]
MSRLERASSRVNASVKNEKDLKKKDNLNQKQNSSGSLIQGKVEKGNGNEAFKKKFDLNALVHKESTPRRLKCFSDLLEEYQPEQLCRRCGGCVTYCKSMKYDAIEFDVNGYPSFSEKTRCIECGICYAICSANELLNEKIRGMVSWEEPSGRVMSAGIYKASDSELQKKDIKSGALTALLLHMMDAGFIDGVIVPSEHNKKKSPVTAYNSEDILNLSDRINNPTLGSMLYGFQPNLSDEHALEKKSTTSSNGSKRLGFVGKPCQVLSLRKMEYLGLMPSEHFSIKIGVFCSEGSNSRGMNACQNCTDYYAEYADISVSDYSIRGEMLAMVSRTSLGNMAILSASQKALQHWNAVH